MQFDRVGVSTLAVASMRGAAVLCVAVGIPVFGAGLAGAAAEDLVPEGPFTMVGAGEEHGQCFAPFPGNTKKLQLYKCDSADKGQQWTAEKLSDDRFKLHNGSGGCLQWHESSGEYDSDMYMLGDCAKAAKFSVKSATDSTVWFKETDTADSTTYLMVAGSAGQLERDVLSRGDLKVNQWVITAL